MKIRKKLYLISIAVAVVSMLVVVFVGCSGGKANTQSSISGVAAAGAPIIGNAYLRDSAGHTLGSVTIGADGSFSFNVTGLRPPFYLRAVGQVGSTPYSLYSATTSSGIANINPLTNAVVAAAAGGIDPVSVYENPATHPVTKANLDKAIKALQTLLEPLLAEHNAENINPISDSFRADHTKLDAVFDLIAITVESSGSDVLIVVIDNSTGDVIEASTDHLETPLFTKIVTVPDDYPTIQAAIQAVIDNVLPAGARIRIAAGTYTEQLNISKDLTIQGAGKGVTKIVSPSTLTTSFSTKKAIVYIHDTANVVIKNLTINGAGLGNSNNAFVGVAFRNAGGTIYNSEIKGVSETPLNGNQHGVAIYALNDNGTNHNVIVTNNTISGYQKNGMALNGANTVATVTGNTVTGAGPTLLTAQNGIQIWGGKGTITGNTVSGNAWTGTYGGSNDPTTDVEADGAAGILLYAPGGIVEIANNTLIENQFGVWTVAAPSINIHNNTITGLAPTGHAFPTGIAIWSADMWLPYFSGIELGTTGTINNNTFASHDYGIIVRDYTVGAPSPNLTASGNRITGNNTFGAWSNVSFNAINNWWGNASGPKHPVSNPDGMGDSVSDNVTFSPRCINLNCTP